MHSRGFNESAVQVAVIDGDESTSYESIYLPKTNMSGKAGFQKEYPLPGGNFQVLC